MKLDFEKIQEITQGVERIVEDCGELFFYRFTEPENELYSLSELYPRTFSTAGVKFHFKTDATELSLNVRVEKLTDISLFAFDIYVNKEYRASIKNYPYDIPKTGYSETNYPIGKFGAKLELLPGDKEIEIYFPWSVKGILKSLELQNSTYVQAVKREKKLLVYGDSIVQGTAAQNPSRVHTVQLADFLEAELHSKAIGSEVYFPELAELKNENYCPDYICVGYGANDWYTLSYEDAEDKCRRFWQAICKNYPIAKKICVSPIWYKNNNEERPFGPLSGAEKIQRKVTGKFPNIIFVRGWELIPPGEDYFVDGVHPNNEGFDMFYRNLKSKLGF